MMISNWKNPFVSMVCTKYFRVVRFDVNFTLYLVLFLARDTLTTQETTTEVTRRLKEAFYNEREKTQRLQDQLTATKVGDTVHPTYIYRCTYHIIAVHSFSVNIINIIQIFTHLKLRVAGATHNFRWVKIWIMLIMFTLKECTDFKFRSVKIIHTIIFENIRN